MNNTEDNMSTNIADLNSDNIENIKNMHTLSDNIQREIEDGKANNYFDSNNLEDIQQMQMKQLQELQKIQELQLKKQLNTESEETEDEEYEESDEETPIKNKSKKSKKKKNSSSIITPILNIVKEPFFILVLYIAISHPKSISFVKKFIPNIDSENVSSSIFFRGLILISIYFMVKMFFLK